MNTFFVTCFPKVSKFSYIGNQTINYCNAYNHHILKHQFLPTTCLSPFTIIMIAPKFCRLFLYAECNIVTISRMGKTMQWLQAIWKVRLNMGCYCLVRLSDRNNLNFVSLWEAARSSYALRVTTGHILESGGKDRKKNSDTGFPGLDCFAKLPGIRTTPSSLYLFPVRFNCDRSSDVDGRVNANNIQLSCFNDSDLFWPHADMCDS